MSKDLKGFIGNLKSQVEIMEGREKGDIDKIIGEVVTIRDYDFLTGDNGQYGVFVLDEYPTLFFFAGMVLTENLVKIEEGGMRDTVINEGLPMTLIKKRSKNSNRYYTNVQFYPEA